MSSVVGHTRFPAKQVLTDEDRKRVLRLGLRGPNLARALRVSEQTMWELLQVGGALRPETIVRVRQRLTELGV